MRMPPLELKLLDEFRLARHGQHIPLGPQLERLLAFLAVHEWPSRYVIANALWPDHPDDAALAALRTAVWRLQHAALGALQAAPRTLRLDPAVHVDLHECTAWAQAVLRAPQSLDDITLPGPDTDGELLPGWDADWLEPERQRLHQLRVHALETAAAEQLARGHTDRAALTALAALRSDPLRESTHRLLVRIHLADTNIGAALAQYDACRRVLQAELGIAPGPELTALVAPYRQRLNTAGQRTGTQNRATFGQQHG